MSANDSTAGLCSDFGINGEGCGGWFPQKLVGGLCDKCEKLAAFEEGSSEYIKLLDYAQCSACGTTYKRLMGKTCGARGCVEYGRRGSPSYQTNAEKSQAERLEIEKLAREAASASSAARAHALDARLSRKPAPAFAPGGPLGKSGPSVSSTGEDNIIVNFECRVKTEDKRSLKAADLDLGFWGRGWKPQTYLSDVLEDALNTVNSIWNKRETLDLNLNEVELRWKGNKRFLPGTENGMLSEVVRKYLTGDMAKIYGSTKTRQGQASGASGKTATEMNLELYIDKEAFLQRRDALVSTPYIGESFISRKRSGTQSVVNTHQQKRPVSSTQIGRSTHASAQFVRTQLPNKSHIPSSTAEIKLVKAATTYDAKTGEVSTVWPDPESRNTLSAVIDNHFMANGKTKQVYKLRLGPEQERHVAKRFYDVGRHSVVSAHQNDKALHADLVRLKNMEYFLNHFLEAARHHDVEHYSGLAVTEAFLIKEIGKPSDASDLPPSDVDRAIWLVEPRRTRAVLKYSGTLGFQNGTQPGKIDATLLAFVHYIFHQSRGQLLYADIQGSKMTIDGQDTLVLFDPMTHSPEKDTGVGDHGKDAIDDYVAQHECNYICTGLCLLPPKDCTRDESDDEVDQLVSEGL